MSKGKSLVLAAVLIFSTSISAIGQTPGTGPSPSSIPTVSSSASSTPATAQKKLVREGNELIIPTVSFSSGTDSLSSDSASSLALIKDYLNQRSDITLLRIEGHVSSEDGADTNQDLSSRRAVAVARWLVANGINCNRLIAVGFGSNKPVAGDNSPLNNRISFYNAALRGRAIGGIPIDGGGVAVPNLCTQISR